MFFQYGEKEITYLKQKDKCLAEVIDKIGKVEREVDGDLFSGYSSYYWSANFYKGTSNNMEENERKSWRSK